MHHLESSPPMFPALQHHQRQQTPSIPSAQQHLQQLQQLIGFRPQSPGLVVPQIQRSATISGTTRPTTQNSHNPQNRSFSGSAIPSPSAQRPLTAQTAQTNQMAAPPPTGAIRGQVPAPNIKISGDGGAVHLASTFAKPSQPTTSTAPPAQGTLAALPPSPPLTRSATRSHSSIATATQQLHSQEVDYLLQNGGLDQAISIAFLPDVDPNEITYRSELNSGEGPQVMYWPGMNAKDEQPLAIFAPLHYSLDSYSSILATGGSIAVGTGYRSVARRLLERVEGIFARDIGLPWGDVLELLRGKKRRERLPLLQVIPVGGFQQSPVEGNNQLEGEAGAVIGANEKQHRTPSPLAPPMALPSPPMQGPDGEVAVHQMLSEGEKIRTKTKVEEWLEETETVLSTTINGHVAGSGRSNSADNHDSSQKALYGAFADQFSPDSQLFKEISLEELEEVERHVSNIILELLNEQLPDQKNLYAKYLEDEELLQRTILALRRLYPTHPPQTITRPIAALYRILNPNMHNILEAIARVTKGELDLLNSGRFDGFLDEKDVIPADEEKELEALEILDGNIFRTMERLEDEIESLHRRAEEVRRCLRVRKEAIVRKIVLATKDGSNSGTARPNTGYTSALSGDPSCGTVTRPVTAAKSNVLSTFPFPPQAQIAAPPPPRSDYFEGVDVSSTIHPLMPEDSASNYGHRHRRRTARKLYSPGNDDGDHGERPRTSSGQMKLVKQMAKEREKKGNREKYEKERERREKEEMKKLKQAAEKAAAGMCAGSGISPSTVFGPDVKDRVGTPPLMIPSAHDKSPKRKKSREDRERDRVVSGEHKKRSGDQNRGVETATMGDTTLVGASNGLDDMLSPLASVTGKEKDKGKKKDKKGEGQHKETYTETEGENKPKKKESKIERLTNLRFSRLLGFDHDAEEGDSPAGATNPPITSSRPGTSGGQSLRPQTSGTIQSVNASGNDKERRERKRDKDRDRNNAIPEVQEEESSNERPVTSSHHSTSHKRRHHHHANSYRKSSAEVHGVEVLSEPEDILGGGRAKQQEFGGFGGVFSDDEGALSGGAGGAAAGIKQQLKRSLRRSKDRKVEKVDVEETSKEDKGDKEKKDKDKDREREKDREKKRDRDKERERERKEKDREREEKERDREKKEKEPKIPVSSSVPQTPQLTTMAPTISAGFIPMLQTSPRDPAPDPSLVRQMQWQQHQQAPQITTTGVRLDPATPLHFSAVNSQPSLEASQIPQHQQLHQRLPQLSYPRPLSETGTMSTATLPTLATSTTAVESYPPGQANFSPSSATPFGITPIEALRRNNLLHQRQSSRDYQNQARVSSDSLEARSEDLLSPRVDNPERSREDRQAKDNKDVDQRSADHGKADDLEGESTTIVGE